MVTPAYLGERERSYHAAGFSPYFMPKAMTAWRVCRWREAGLNRMAADPTTVTVDIGDGCDPSCAHVCTFLPSLHKYQIKALMLLLLADMQWNLVELCPPLCTLQCTA